MSSCEAAELATLLDESARSLELLLDAASDDSELSSLEATSEASSCVISVELLSEVSSSFTTVAVPVLPPSSVETTLSVSTALSCSTTCPASVTISLSVSSVTCPFSE